MSQIFNLGFVYTTPETSRSFPAFACLSNARLPTDPLFLATITLNNIVIDSRYYVVIESDESVVLSQGVAASSVVELQNIPAYTNPMLVKVKVRKGTDGLKYIPFTGYGYLIKDGLSVWVSQVQDNVLNG